MKSLFFLMNFVHLQQTVVKLPVVLPVFATRGHWNCPSRSHLFILPVVMFEIYVWLLLSRTLLSSINLTFLWPINNPLPNSGWELEIYWNNVLNTSCLFEMGTWAEHKMCDKTLISFHWSSPPILKSWDSAVHIPQNIFIGNSNWFSSSSRHFRYWYMKNVVWERRFSLFYD